MQDNINVDEMLEIAMILEGRFFSVEKLETVRVFDPVISSDDSLTDSSAEFRLQTVP